MWRQFNRRGAVLCMLAMGLCLAASPGRLEAQIIFGSAGKTQLDAFSGTFNNEVRFNNFSIVYLDEGDGFLDFAEIVSFTGVDTILPPLTTYTNIVYVPQIDGVANASGTLNPTLPCLTCWEFLPAVGGTTSDGWDFGYWSYESIPFNSSITADDVINNTSTPLSPGANDLTFGPEIQLTLFNVVLDVTNGSTITTGSLVSDDTGIITVDGAGSRIDLIADRPRMVLQGPNTSLDVLNGGVVDASSICVSGTCDLAWGNQTGDDVLVQVIGAGSQLNTANNIAIGFADTDISGPGVFGADSNIRVNVTNGGEINVDGGLQLGVGFIGSSVQPGQTVNAFMDVVGADAQVAVTGALDVAVGATALANLNVGTSATVAAGSLNIGLAPGANGTVTVSNNGVLAIDGGAVVGDQGQALLRVSTNSIGTFASDLQVGAGATAIASMEVLSASQVFAPNLSVAGAGGGISTAVADLTVRGGGSVTIDGGSADALVSIGDADGAAGNVQVFEQDSSLLVFGQSGLATLAIGTDQLGPTGAGSGTLSVFNNAGVVVSGTTPGDNNVIVGEGRTGTLNVTTDGQMSVLGSLFLGAGGNANVGLATGGQLDLSASAASTRTGRLGIDVGVNRLDGLDSFANLSVLSPGSSLDVTSLDPGLEAYIDIGVANVAGRAGGGAAFGRVSVTDGGSLNVDGGGSTGTIALGLGANASGELNISGLGAVVGVTGTSGSLVVAGSSLYGAVGDGSGILRVQDQAGLFIDGSDPGTSLLSVGVGAGTGSVLLSGDATIQVDGDLIVGTPVAYTGVVTGNATAGFTVLDTSTVQTVNAVVGSGGTLFGESTATFIADTLRVESGGGFNFQGDVQIADVVLDGPGGGLNNTIRFDIGRTGTTSQLSALNGARVTLQGGANVGSARGDSSYLITNATSQLFLGGADTVLNVGVDGGVGDFTLSDTAVGLFDGTALGTFVDQTQLNVGFGGTGAFTVASGGRFTMQDTLAGADGNTIRIGVSGVTTPGSGQLVVDGNLSNLTLRNRNAAVEVGLTDADVAGSQAGTGALDVTNNGLLFIDGATGIGALTIGRGASASGTVNVNSGGSIIVQGDAGGRLLVGTDEGASSAGGSGVLNIDGGFVDVSSPTPDVSEAYVGFGSGDGSVLVSNGGFFSVAGNLFVSAPNPENGTNTQSGTVALDGGQILANQINIGNNGSLTGSGDAFGLLTVDPGGLLSLDGTIVDDVVNQGGVVSPGGDGLGTLSVSGDYIQTDGALQLTLAGFNIGEYDQLNVGGNVDLQGGSVDLDFQNGLTALQANGLPVIRAGGALTIDPTVAYNVGAGLPAFELTPFEIFETDPQTGQQVAVQLGVVNFLGQDLSELAETLGYTPNEVSLVESLEQSCASAINDPDLNDDQIDFLNMCANVRNAGNTPEQILQSLKALDTEEVMQLINSIFLFTIPQHGNLSQRINGIRHGADPFDLTAMNIMIDGNYVAGADLNRFVKGLIGGGASASDEFAKWGMFGNANFNFGDREGTENGDGYDFETMSVTMGVDYRARDNLVFGGSLSYSDVNADYNEGGGMNLKSWAASFFGTYFVKDKYYVDVLATYGRNDIDSRRHITFDTSLGSYDRRANASTEGDQYSISVGTGYDFTKGAWVFGPHGGANYRDVNANSYTEQGADGLNLTVGNQTATSLTGNLGFHVSYTLTPKWGVLIPYLRADWVHEFKQDAEVTPVNFSVARFMNDPNNPSIPMKVKTDRRDANYAIYSAGVSAQFIRGIAGFINYRAAANLTDIDVTDITWGLRFEQSW